MHRTVWALVGWVVGVALHVQQPALWAAPDYVLFLALAHIPIGFIAIVFTVVFTVQLLQPGYFYGFCFLASC